MIPSSGAKVFRTLFALGASCLLFSCTLGPDFVQPTVPLPDAFSAPTDTTATVDLDRWWETFHDPLLQVLLKEALSENLDLKLAETRVKTARAELSVADASLLPQPELNGSVTRSKTSANVAQGRSQNSGSGSGTPTTGTGSGIPNGLQQTPGSIADLFRAGFDATWELDLFGRIRSQIEVASNLYQAQIEVRNGAFITLLAEIARNYIELRGSQRQIETVEKNIALQSESLEIQRLRSRVGISSDLSVAQAETVLAQTRSDLPPLIAQTQRSIHRLSILLGKEPRALSARLEVSAPVPIGPSAINAGLPSDLLRRRPDIRASEMRLRAANAQIGVAIADLFPKFSLTGSLGLQTRHTPTFFDEASSFWSVGSTVNWAILSWPAIQANIALQDSKKEEVLSSTSK